MPISADVPAAPSAEEPEPAAAEPEPEPEPDELEPEAPKSASPPPPEQKPVTVTVEDAPKTPEVASAPRMSPAVNTPTPTAVSTPKGTPAPGKGLKKVWEEIPTVNTDKVCARAC